MLPHKAIIIIDIEDKENRYYNWISDWGQPVKNITRVALSSLSESLMLPYK